VARAAAPAAWTARGAGADSAAWTGTARRLGRRRAGRADAARAAAASAARRPGRRARHTATVAAHWLAAARPAPAPPELLLGAPTPPRPPRTAAKAACANAGALSNRETGHLISQF
jgi:hypothetical protein